MFVETKNPSKYGIFYIERANELPKLLMFEKEEDCDSAFSCFLQKGEFFDENHYLPMLIKPFYFIKAEFPEKGYVRESLFGKSEVGDMKRVEEGTITELFINDQLGVGKWNDSELVNVPAGGEYWYRLKSSFTNDDGLKEYKCNIFKIDRNEDEEE